MYTLLIIDDEELIGSGVKAKLERANVAGIRDIHVADGGMLGLAMAKALQPHIIITDIRMPELDGIQLIKELAPLLPRAKFIMLSGYGDYSYVREAFKYGALDYLLKPASSDELGKQVQSAIASIENDHRNDRLAARSLTDARALLTARLPLVIHGTNVAASSKDSESQQSLEAYFSHPLFAVSLLSFGDVTFSEEHLDTVSDCLERCVQDDNLAPDLRFLAFHDGQGRVSLVLNYAASVSSETVQGVLGQAVIALRKSNPRLPVASISQSGRGLDHLSRLYKQAHQTMAERILREPSDVFATVDPWGRTDAWLPGKKELEEFKQAAESLHAERIGLWVDRHLSDSLRPRMSLEQLKSIYDLALSEIHRHVHDRFLFEETERAAAFDTIHTLGELRHYIKSYAADTKRLISEHAHLGDTVITVAESIVRQHYSRDLQLAEVANRVSMNYSYFSKLFKERTGLTFTAYLTKVRMEEAQKLLKNPTLRINEISEKVGYSNLYHFSRAFKNYFGVSPKEHRKTM
ncbi:helix-turn-helix domain-containing protein [Paenibacillus methanolicus]|uniref:YesN/AraC family two-component response regulator n=1 Tax=Paenibacillus methanolicus TaxID=582686 RepID=A0A5S5CC47_9BACL|nr:helix-turn-helix domain-containing protein [Paenibacillus methanolicus]TYP76729.1 YesN/AraC family two-component response regulator [Paenibacillus methanolicus]